MKTPFKSRHIFITTTFLVYVGQIKFVTLFSILYFIVTLRYWRLPILSRNIH